MIMAYRGPRRNVAIWAATGDRCGNASGAPEFACRTSGNAGSGYVWPSWSAVARPSQISSSWQETFSKCGQAPARGTAM